MLKRDNEEEIKNYKRKELNPGTLNPAFPGNMPMQNSPQHNKPMALEEYLHQYSSEGKGKKEIKELETPSEHKNIIQEQSNADQLLKDETRKEDDPKEKEEQKIYQSKRFKRPFDMDEQGMIRQTPVSGTVTSRYTILNNSLHDVKLDQLTVYDDMVDGTNRQKFESMTVKFSSLDIETQLMIRKRLQRVNRKLSKDGIKFIADSEGSFRKRVYNAETGKDATKEEIAAKLSTKGDWTIGYGHKLTPSEIQKGTYLKEISEDDGLAIYNNDLAEYVRVVNDRLKAFVTQNEFDALVSFAYQQGKYNSTLMSVLALVNQYRFDEAAQMIQETGSKKGRRKAESEIFRHSIYIPAGYYDGNSGAVKESYYKKKDPEGYKKYKDPLIF